MKVAKQKAYQYGMDAEATVANIISEQGFDIICSRYHTPFGEIDIVARHGEYLVFIEVKARNKMPDHDIVPRSKIVKICKAADFYLLKHDLHQNTGIRFDYVALEGDRVVSHLQNAWDYCVR